MLHGQHLLEGKRMFILPDVLVLALTPGIPFEWVMHVGKFGAVRESELKRLIRDATPEDHALAAANAASITEDDAFAMLRITKRAPVPMYVQLWLAATPLTNAKVAKLTGHSPANIGSWRRTINFDPLTGIRL